MYSNPWADDTNSGKTWENNMNQTSQDVEITSIQPGKQPTEENNKEKEYIKSNSDDIHTQDPMKVQPIMTGSGSNIGISYNVNIAIERQQSQAKEEERTSLVVKDLHTVEVDPLGASLLNSDADSPELVSHGNFPLQGLVEKGAGSYLLPDVIKKSLEKRVDQLIIGGEHDIYECQLLQPLMIGDKLTGHISYRLVTRTISCTSSWLRNSECSVMRRYLSSFKTFRFSDFAWLYDNLIQIPGLIIPPLPSKLSVGRFDPRFIEGRRRSLERFISGVVAHPLMRVPAVKFFLESETFKADAGGSNGFFGPRFGGDPSNFPVMGDDLTSGFGFDLKARLVTEQENGLFALAKALDAALAQRKGNSDVDEGMREMAEAFKGLVSPSNSNTTTLITDPKLLQKFSRLSEIHERIADIQKTELAAGIDDLSERVEESIRTVTSIRIAFWNRKKLIDNLNDSENTLTKLESSLLKYSDAKIRTDKIEGIKALINEAQKEVEIGSKALKECSQLLDAETIRVEVGRKMDGAHGLLAGVLKNQKEILQIWKTYYN